MSEALAGLLTGAKVAIFILAITITYLARLRVDDFDFKWIGATAFAFLVNSVIEFIVIMDAETGTTLVAWIVDLSNQVLLTDTMYLIAGITTFMFLRSVKQETTS